MALQEIALLTSRASSKEIEPATAKKGTPEVQSKLDLEERSVPVREISVDTAKLQLGTLNSNARVVSSTPGKLPLLPSSLPSTLKPDVPFTPKHRDSNSPSPRTATPDLSLLKVLYAEDNKINQKVLGRMLKKLGVEDLDIVENGQEAVDISAKKSYDLIFMDIEMPVLDGLGATQLIKERETESPQIIFCTAHAVTDFRTKAFGSGGDGFISKPFNLKQIKAALEDPVLYQRPG